MIIMKELEELVEHKEHEIEKLSKLKDALKEQLAKFKGENASLKEEIEGLKSQDSTPAYPDFSEELEEASKEIEKLKEQLQSELWREVHYEPIAGRCIMFPSWLWHEVKPNESNDIRISVSFNFLQR